MTVAGAGVAPELVLGDGILGKSGPDWVFYKLHAAADDEHDPADLAVPGAQAAVRGGIRIARAVVVAVTEPGVIRLPHHVRILSKIRLAVTERGNFAVSADGAVLDVGGQFVGPLAPSERVGFI